MSAWPLGGGVIVSDDGSPTQRLEAPLQTGAVAAAVDIASGKFAGGRLHA